MPEMPKILQEITEPYSKRRIHWQGFLGGLDHPREKERSICRDLVLLDEQLFGLN